MCLDSLVWAGFAALKAATGALAGIAWYLSERVPRRWWRCFLAVSWGALGVGGNVRDFAADSALPYLPVQVAAGLITGALLGSVLYLFAFGAHPEQPTDFLRADPDA